MYFTAVERGRVIKNPAEYLWINSRSKATEEKLQLWLQGRPLCFLRRVNFIISFLIRNEGCQQFLFCVFFLLTEKHFEQQPISSVLGELWEQGELFSMKHWKAIKTDPKYDCMIYSIIHLNGNVVVSFLKMQVAAKAGRLNALLTLVLFSLWKPGSQWVQNRDFP